MIKVNIGLKIEGIEVHANSVKEAKQIVNNKVYEQFGISTKIETEVIIHSESYMKCPKCNSRVLYVDGKANRMVYVLRNGELNLDTLQQEVTTKKKNHGMVVCNDMECDYETSYLQLFIDSKIGL